MNFFCASGASSVNNKPKHVNDSYLTLGCSSTKPLAPNYIISAIFFLNGSAQASEIIPKKMNPADLNVHEAFCSIASLTI